MTNKAILVNQSSVIQNVDAIVNAANNCLMAGGGVCGAIFAKAGYIELQDACNKYETPLKDGDAVITPSFNIKNAKAIIHAVGPDFWNTPNAFAELFDAYYNSLVVLKNNGYHSISFPLISSGIFGGRLENPVQESTKQFCRAYKKFTKDYPDYHIEALLCVYNPSDMNDAKTVFDKYFN